MSTSNPDTFSMIPADTASDPADDLAAAAAGAVAPAAGLVPVAPDTPIPFGRSWVFDYQHGQFVWQGASPQQTSTEFGGLEQWCLMALYSTRFASVVFSATFGREDPDEPIGQLPSTEVATDYIQHVQEALLVHDRITEVDVEIDWDPQTGILTLTKLDVITDEDDQVLRMNNVQIPLGGSS